MTSPARELPPHGGLLCYSLGGGLGHVQRGLAVLRRVRRRHPDLPVALLAPGRAAPWAAAEGVPLVSPPEGLPTAAETPGAPSRETLGAWVTATLDRWRPATLLIDVFPRGVLGELSLVPATSWPGRTLLLARAVRPSYYLAPALQRWLHGDRIGELLWCERPPPELRALSLPQREVAPVLVRRPDECLSRAAARARLGIGSPRERLVLALGSGSATSQQALARLLERVAEGLRVRLDVPVRVHLASAELRAEARGALQVGPLLPAMEVLRGADVVVAAGGYHAAHETAALEVPAVFLPQRRRYDDQHARVKERRCARTPVALAVALEHVLGPAPSTELASPPPLGPVSERPDGAAQVAAALGYGPGARRA